jgi:2-keto-4-pentenoate hydratase/2-oxohepta-3-ene-1,7-dioic acid hydratase in catechol pathway
MKLVSFSHHRRTRIGILEDDTIWQTSFEVDMLALLQRGVRPSKTSERYKLDAVTLRPPFSPGKIIAVGRNYADHAAELGNEVPQTPLLFTKLPTSVIGPGQAITWREDVTTQVDWEGELALVIGKRGKHISADDAYDHIFGYTIANDVSARDLQATEGQWTRAKGLDTFCPLGPMIVTRDEIDDPHALSIKTTVNDETMQDDTTANMIHKIPALIAELSRTFTLLPGDLILTGTPAGVGKGMEPPRFLQDGDTVNVTIAGLGTLSNPCRVES